MKQFKASIPTLLLIAFEVSVGILLLVNPEAFTRTVIILFGIVLLVIGLTYLLRYLRVRKEEDFASLGIAVASLVVGVVCTFFSGVILGLIAAIAVIYGMILLISGIYKLCAYFRGKKAQLPVSPISVASGVLAILLGMVLIIYPEGLALSVWQIAGIMLLVEAVLDIISVINT